jgi:hypothetical protein
MHIYSMNLAMKSIHFLASIGHLIFLSFHAETGHLGNFDICSAKVIHVAMDYWRKRNINSTITNSKYTPTIYG